MGGGEAEAKAGPLHDHPLFAFGSKVKAKRLFVLSVLFLLLQRSSMMMVLLLIQLPLLASLPVFSSTYFTMSPMSATFVVPPLPSLSLSFSLALSLSSSLPHTAIRRRRRNRPTRPFCWSSGRRRGSPRPQPERHVAGLRQKRGSLGSAQAVQDSQVHGFPRVKGCCFFSFFFFS